MLCARKEPGGACSKVALHARGGVGHVPDARGFAIEGLWVPAARFLEAVEADAHLVGRFLDRLEQGVDGSMTRRCGADALAMAEEMCDQPRRRPRLARSWRALDHQMASIE